MNIDDTAASPTEPAPGPPDPGLAWSAETDRLVEDHPPTGGVPVPSQPWSGIIALAGTILIAATLVVGGVLLWDQFRRPAPPVAAAPILPEPAPSTVTVTAPPPPPVTVTATPAPPVPTTSVPPLATPQARVAEPIICSMAHRYPQMQPVDLALSLVDRGIYRSYDEAAVVVDMVLADGCHGI